MKILVAGDSHAEAFRFIRGMNCISIKAASAYGLANPDSRTQARKTIIEKVNSKEWDWIFLHFGEVDCGFLIFERMARHSISLEEAMHDSILNYFSFINDLEFKIMVLGVNIPRCTGRPINLVPHRARWIKDDFPERKEVNLTFNKILKEKCNEIGHLYTDINDLITDPQTGSIREDLISRKDQIHMNLSKAADIWRKRLKEMGFKKIDNDWIYTS